MAETPLDPEEDFAFSKYFSHFGAFAAYWLYYEHIIEILIRRELRLETKETSILCCAMAFGVKLNVLKALLRRKPENQKVIDMFGQVQAAAERNSVTHGFLVRAPDGVGVDLVTRDVQQGKYVVKSQSHNAVAHMRGFMDALSKLQTIANVPDAEINEYSEAVAADAKAYSDRDNSHPVSPENSPLPNPE